MRQSEQLVLSMRFCLWPSSCNGLSFLNPLCTGTSVSRFTSENRRQNYPNSYVGSGRIAFPEGSAEGGKFNGHYYPNNILVTISDWTRLTGGTQPSTLSLHAHNCHRHIAGVLTDFIALDQMK
jgi:hypothetical protein